MVACKVKRISGKRTWKFWLILGLLLMLAVGIWLETNLRPIILRMAEAKCRAISVSVLQNSVFEVLAGQIEYDDLITVRLDGQGRVSMLQANTVKMNQLSTTIAMKAQKALTELDIKQVAIPLGSALGSKLFAGEGPRIPVRVYPVGSVSTGFNSEFEASGINQTRHKVYLTIASTIQIVIPTEAQNVDVKESILVAESIIVGQVPENFYNLDSTDQLLDLLN